VDDEEEEGEGGGGGAISTVCTVYGIICIKDTYVVCKYVKKTVLETVLYGV
jgi:hypothetical protein